MAIDVVADGSIWAPRRVLAKLLDSYAPASNTRVELRFTPRERELLEHLVEGRSDREIAERLGISVRTSQNMVANLMRKAGVRNRVILAAAVLSRGGTF